MLQGRLSSGGMLGGSLSASDGLGGALTVGGASYPVYDGETEFAPSESVQAAETHGKTVLTDITIDAIPGTYVGSAVDRRDSDDLAASGATVTAPAGYYAEPASKAVASGSITMRKPTMDEAVGEIRSRADLTTGYVTGGSYGGSALILDKQAGTTITPTESEQVAVAQYRWTTGDVKVAAIPSQYIVPTGTYTVTGSGTHDVTAHASASVASATPTNSSESEYITSSGARKWRYRPKTIVPTAGWADQHSASNPINGFWVTYDAIPTGTTVAPTTSAQTIGGADTMMEGAVTVAAIPPEYIVPSGTKSITASGTHDVTEYASASVAAGSATMPSSMSGSGTIVGALNNTMNVQGTITATPTVSAGYVSAGTSGSTNVSLQTSVTTLNATTYSPQASDRTIAAGTYTIGTQTIKGAPLQSKSVTTNGTVTADAGYYGLSSVDVSVSGSTPNLQAKTGITPSTSSQTVTYDAGYDGLSSVQIDAMPAGSIGSQSWADSETATSYIMTASFPSFSAGYISTAPTVVRTLTKQEPTITPSTSTQTVTPNNANSYISKVTVSAMPSGSAKPAASISSTGATLSTGTGTIILTKSVTNVPDVVAGYVASGTSGATSITLQATATLKGATTYHPSTSDQAIASGTYLTGAQTIKAVTTSNLTAANIKQGVTVTVGDSTDADCVASVTGTYSGGGGGSSMNVQVAQSTTRIASTAYSKTASLTCSVAGKYDVYWDCYRSSTSGTSGSQLYIAGSAYGTANTTFSNNIQTNHLTGVTLAANQEVAVYVRSRGTSYYAYCGTLVIKQTS